MQKIFYIFIIIIIIIIIIFLNIKNIKPEKIVYAIGGEIESVKDNKLKLKFNNQYIILSNKKFKIFEFNKSTKIFKYIDTIKSKEQFNQEQNEFYNKIKKFKQQNKEIIGVEAPSWHLKKEINITELKKGNKVKIYYYSDNKKHLIINKIILQLNKFEQIDIFELSNDQNINKIFCKIRDIRKKEIDLNLHDFDSTIVPSFKKLVTISINNDTQIIEKKIKSNEDFEKEQFEFYNKIKQMKDSGEVITNVSAPNLYTTKNVGLNNLKKEQEIVVFVIENNIRKEIIAKKIEYIIK